MPTLTPHVFALAHTQVDDIVLRDTNQGKLRREVIKKRNKRKAGDLENDDDEVEEGTPEFSTDRLSRETTAFVSLTAHEHAQRRAAGLAPGEDIPDGPFPHHSKSGPGRGGTAILSEVRRELQDLDVPLPHLDPETYAPQPYRTNKGRTTLREQHVAVLTTLLHTCLGRGDYARAGRAWAFLLRSGNLTRDTNVRKGIAGMDLRTQERWGIGSELLMRRQQTSSSGKGKAHVGEDSDNGYLDFSDEGFALARRYYERLIVQYPSGARRRIGAQATTFYTAMFSAWIYEVQRRYRHNPTIPPPHHSDSEDEDSEDSPQLRDVGRIIDRVDQIIDSPPYDKNGELLHMRGMLELWVLDLMVDVGDEERGRGMRKAAGLFRKAERFGEELGRLAREVADEYVEEPEEEEIVVDEDEDQDAVMEDG